VRRHDCFTICELDGIRRHGLVPYGHGSAAVCRRPDREDRRFRQSLGGLQAKGHPIGATGVSMHAITAMQLTSAPAYMQVKNARLGGILHMGGKTAVANHTLIPERIRVAAESKTLHAPWHADCSRAAGDAKLSFCA